VVAAVGACPPLLFIHIRKTAGTSVFRMLEQRFGVGRFQIAWGDNFIGDPNDFDFVVGHFDFTFVDRFRTRPIVATFLRKPIDRALSMWRFAHEDVQPPPRMQAPELNRARVIQLELFRVCRERSLLDLLLRAPALARPFLGSYQTALLMGVDFGRRAVVPTTSVELAQAKRNLERCDVIGLTEDVDGSMAWLARRMGWGLFGPAWVQNVSKLPACAVEVDPRALAILTEWNELDLELYEYARQLIAERREHCPATPPAALPRPEAYRFDQPIHGIGWSERERDADGWMCWTGGEPASSLDFAATHSTRDHLLRIRIAHVIRQDALDLIRLSVNDQALSVRAGVGADGGLSAGGQG
jgi:hypothetical protein